MNVQRNRIEVSKDEDKPAQRMTVKGFWGKEIVVIITLIVICLTLFFFRLGARPFAARDTVCPNYWKAAVSILFKI